MLTFNHFYICIFRFNLRSTKEINFKIYQSLVSLSRIFHNSIIFTAKAQANSFKVADSYDYYKQKDVIHLEACLYEMAPVVWVWTNETQATV